MNVLLIWECLPEHVDYYEFTNPSKKLLDLMEKSNGEFGGATENDSNAVELSIYLYEIKDTLKKVDNECNFNRIKYDKIFCSGFYM